jgi:hypothetical protein
VAQGAVTAVISQGQCKADYAFAAVGSIEGISFIHSQKLQAYSAQEVVDCSYNYGNNGCTDGSIKNSLEFILTRGSLSSIKVFPLRMPILSMELREIVLRLWGHSKYQTTLRYRTIAPFLIRL